MSKHVLHLMVDCREYSFLVKEDVQILHGDQLTCYKVLFANGCWGLYNLKCLKLKFSPTGFEPTTT